VFFVREDDLWVDATPVNEALLYGDMRTHDRGHEAFWEQLQASGAAPRDEEYDECPRGRVCYDTKQRIFHLYLDQCIREKYDAVSRIIRAMNLPSATRVELAPTTNAQGAQGNCLKFPPCSVTVSSVQAL
jgi:hypothetical protein